MNTKISKIGKPKLSKSLSNLFSKDGYFHFKGCGLDNVYIKGWVTVADDGAHYFIDDAEDLYNSIGKCLVENSQLLTGKEFRFIRKELNLTQSKLAGWLGVDTQTVARWEKGETALSQSADRVLRFQYIAAKHPHEEVSYLGKLIEDLDELDIDVAAHKSWMLDRNQTINS